MKSMKILKEITSYSTKRQTTGLNEKIVETFIKKDKRLVKAIDEAYEKFQEIKEHSSEILRKPEVEQIEELQKGFVNFYNKDTINPYVPLAARGPWIVTSCGAVIHDSGGYGMLGFGHAPDEILDNLGSSTHIMANIMTASFQHQEFIKALRNEIGQKRPESHKSPYHSFFCLNSGSESVTLAMRISDVQAKMMTSPDGPSPSHSLKYLSLTRGFHGRTDLPAQVSDSCLSTYRQHLASYVDKNNLHTVPPNDVKSLEAQFAFAKKNKVFYQAMLIEPVLGEGRPGVGITPEFYQRARQLTKEMGSLLIVDSIQAGFRAHGCLSIVDYPGFETLDPPDCETYSKALNAGQYPLSTLAVTESTSKIYQQGLYGNTMTTNPRALQVATTVLKKVTPAIRQNIQDRGREFMEKFATLTQEFPDLATSCQGTGLLFCLNINPQKISVVGSDGLEQRLRRKGIGVIHGGENALRFTPPFDITSDEVDLIVSNLRDILQDV